MNILAKVIFYFCKLDIEGQDNVLVPTFPMSFKIMTCIVYELILGIFYNRDHVNEFEDN